MCRVYSNCTKHVSTLCSKCNVDLFLGCNLSFHKSRSYTKENYPSKHASSGQCWPSVGRVGKTLENFPTLFQRCQCFANIFAKAVIIVIVSFLEFFSQFFNDSGSFSFIYRYPICQKYFFLVRFSQRWWNIGSTSVSNIGIMHFNQYRANVGFQPQANIAG